MRSALRALYDTRICTITIYIYNDAGIAWGEVFSHGHERKIGQTVAEKSGEDLKGGRHVCSEIDLVIIAKSTGPNCDK